MQYEAEVEIDTPHGYLEGVPASFELDVERFPAEPFAPAGIQVTAQFDHLTLNGLKLRRDEAVSWLGEETINRLEHFIEELEYS